MGRSPQAGDNEAGPWVVLLVLENKDAHEVAGSRAGARSTARRRPVANAYAMDHRVCRCSEDPLKRLPRAG